MADRVYPSTKPAVNGGSSGVPRPAATATATPAVAAPPGAVKPQLYNPNRQPYRPQPYSQTRRSRRKMCSCCCCLFWSILLILILALIAAIAGTAFWVIYRPHSPSFSISNLRLSKLNLTSTTDTSHHLTSAMNLTVSTSNPNKKISFFYDRFTLSVLSGSNVLIANGSTPGFVSAAKDGKSTKLELKNSADLDVETAKSLKSDLKKKRLEMKVRVDTRVRVKIGKMKTKKVIIRVTCEGIHGTVPTGKTTAMVASTADSKCSVDLRFKIWKFTF